jgi:Mn2+/Fe2+ NRAMP family transporter
MDFTVIYALGVLSAIHLLLVAYTGKSINRNETVDPKKDPARFKFQVIGSAALVAVALAVWLASWLFGLENPS